MKKIFLVLLVALSFSATAQDLTPIVVNVRDNAKLQYGGAAVKMKVLVLQYSPISNTDKNFTIRVLLQMYENLSGSYGGKITDLLQADVTLSDSEKEDLLQRYADREIFYTTLGKWVDINGNSVSVGTPGAQTELTYWQSFKLNNASLNMGTLSTQGALDAEYKIINAIILKLNQRKNF